MAQGYDIDQQNIQNYISIHTLNHQWLQVRHTQNVDKVKMEFQAKGKSISKFVSPLPPQAKTLKTKLIDAMKGLMHGMG